MRMLLALLVGAIPGIAFADEGDDTLRMYLSKSDVVVLGEFASEPLGETDELGVVHYHAEFKIEQLIKGEPKGDRREGGTMRVNIVRFEMEPADRLPELKEGGRCILFLKANEDQETPTYTSADFWFAVQRPNSMMVRSLARLVEEVAASPDSGRLDVSRNAGADGGSIRSMQDFGDGQRIAHGLQVIVGPNNVLQEYLVYNRGKLEQRTQFYPTGKVFRAQRREHDGSGYEVISTAEDTKVIAESVIVDGGIDIGPIKTQENICFGWVKDDRCWEGQFLVPVQDMFERKVMLQTYREGKLIESVPFPVEKLNLSEKHRDAEEWPWDFPDWPVAPE